MRAAKTLILILLLGSVLIGCGREPVQQQLLRSMAQFDRAYIPTLILAERQRPKETAVAFRLLTDDWRDFYAKYYNLELKYGVNITDEYWESDFDKIDSLIKDSGLLIGKKKLTEARDLLEPIQGIFNALRHRHNFDYFLDRMTTFNSAQTELRYFVARKNRLSDNEKRRLAVMNSELVKKWRWVQESRINWKTYGFTPAKVKAIKPLLEEVGKALSGVSAVVPTGDPRTVKQAVDELSVKYDAAYRVFGDFQPIFDEINKPKLEKKKAQAKVKAKKKK